jgi:hypothetical protein
MTHDNFKDMATCDFCGSGTFTPIQIVVVGKISGTYCDTCWKEYGSPIKVKP